MVEKHLYPYCGMLYVLGWCWAWGTNLILLYVRRCSRKRQTLDTDPRKWSCEGWAVGQKVCNVSQYRCCCFYAHYYRYISPPFNCSLRHTCIHTFIIHTISLLHIKWVTCKVIFEEDLIFFIFMFQIDYQWLSGLWYTATFHWVGDQGGVRGDCGQH